MSKQYKSDFKIFDAHPNFIYLDNTATTPKPKLVVDTMCDFLNNDNATVHRGIYGLSQKATDRCEAVRDKVKTFINAERSEEIIFTKGTTEAINLVAESYGSTVLEKGDDILITTMEHHANIVPWQIIAKKMGCSLKVCPISESGELDIAAFEALLSNKTKVVAFVHISNVLGTINPVSELIALSRKKSNAIVLVDGAQAIAHIPVDVQALDCDFYVFSGHKMYGPTGVGVLYGKKALLDAMPPYQSGGDMIESVTFEKTTFAKVPAKFEAGTPMIAEIIGLGAAIDYINSISFDVIQHSEKALLSDAVERLSTLNGIRLIGTAAHKEAIVSFVVDSIHPHDVGTWMDQENIAVRVGHHCAQPLMTRYNVPATVRASFCFYNTINEVEALVDALKKAQEYFL